MEKDTTTGGTFSKEAETYINLFCLFADAIEKINPTRYNKEFMQVFPEIKSENAPFVWLFDGFTAGLDTADKIMEAARCG